MSQEANRRFISAETQSILSEIISKQSVEKIARKYLSLTEVAQAAMLKIRGVPEHDLKKLRAAFTLADYLSKEVLPKPLLLDNPNKIANLIREDFRLLEHEELKLILMDNKLAHIRTFTVGVGNVHSASADARKIFKLAITFNATQVALVHNHPTGHTKPSGRDISLTNRLVEAGEILDVKVVDHIIMGKRMVGQEDDFCSLQELGYI